MKHRPTLAIIGSGPSCIYLLKHLLDDVETFRERLAAIDVFEKRRTAGMGMPYNPETTERWNMANISSEEIPALTISLADWLRGLDATRLREFGIEPEEVSDSEVYSRLVLGEYLHAQFLAIIAGLAAAGISVQERANCKIVDVRETGEQVTLIDDAGAEFAYDRVVLATGHYWPEADHPEAGYYVSPWPISKLVPPPSEIYNFNIGTLGASLSAFDVVSSLAHRHGEFAQEEGRLIYRPLPDTGGFRITMHAGDGLLPHLQYAQVEPLRDIERHVSEQQLLALRDDQGFLRLATFFDRVCRPVLIAAFERDSMPEIARLLQDSEFGLEEFAEKMTAEHEYPDAFLGMRAEMKEAEDSVNDDCPIHWKESIDDLMYTLNFYAELMPAEDHLTLRSKFIPFLMNVIAALPLASARKLLALHAAGKLEMVIGRVQVTDPEAGDTTTTVEVDDDGHKKKFTYRMFVDCSGQGPLQLEDFPFGSLVQSGAVREARVAFCESQAADDVPETIKNKLIEEAGRWFYPIGGVDIDRAYHLIRAGGDSKTAVFDISFPHTSGTRPYSYGLQACNDTARLLVTGWRTMESVPA